MSAAPAAPRGDGRGSLADSTGHPVVMAAAGSVLLGSGPVQVLTAERSDRAEWADEVLAVLAGPDGGRIGFGALSFRGDGPARLLRPRSTSRIAQADLAPVLAAPEAYRGALSVIEAPSGAEYGAAVAAAVERIVGPGNLRKVVLGRWLDILAEPAIDSRQLLAELSRRHPGQYLFSVPLDGEAVLVGASPELLVSRRGASIRSTPLAGSMPRSADPDEDRRRGDALLDSAKDLAEHRYVIEAIAEALDPLCRDLDVPSAPVVISTDTMWHLASPIRGTLAAGAGSRLSALHLAQLLHPTPAVGGSPRDAAYGVIAELEAEDRGFLTGAVGWVDADGDGDWAVTIRAGVLDGASMRLFAGAGIVADSVPASEIAETQGKLSTMLRAVGG